MRRAAVLLTVAAVLTGCGGSRRVEAPPAPPPSAAVPIDPAVPAPAFLLRDQSGRRTGPQRDRGHWTVVTFLYTHCPDVCPLIANRLVAAQRANAGLRVVAVSVDPARDTQAAVRRFLAAHRAGPRFRFVRGTRRELGPVWRRYHVAALPGTSGTVSHSALSILVDPQGRERALFDAQVTADAVLRAIAERA